MKDDVGMGHMKNGTRQVSPKCPDTILKGNRMVSSFTIRREKHYLIYFSRMAWNKR